MNDIYDLVRRSDSKVMCSFPAGGRYQLYTLNGLVSMRLMSDEEISVTPKTLDRLLARHGYCVSPSSGS